MNPDQITEFWMEEKHQPLWFQSTPEFDQLLRDTFLSQVEAAEKGKLDDWRKSPGGVLALILLLDQFPLNIFRGQARGYQCGDIALTHAKYAIEHNYLPQYSKTELAFVLLPLMHSEQLADQNLCVQLMDQYELTENAKYARHHRDIIRQFGRFPHRNQALGRDSTTEELAYLSSDSAFKG